jgi:CheY-like chemotaxis protein/biotin operon repressor
MLLAVGGDASSILLQSKALEKLGMNVLFVAEAEFRTWLASSPRVTEVTGILIAAAACQRTPPSLIADHTRAPLIALLEAQSLETTLSLFGAGVDDVVRSPVNPRELMARFDVVRRRERTASRPVSRGAIRVFVDGRDPQLNGSSINLPRRERMILEYLASQTGRYVTKSQLFRAAYGMFESEVSENTVESHVSKLRKKLKERLGYDPIDSRRHEGYCLSEPAPTPASEAPIERYAELTA